MAPSILGLASAILGIPTITTFIQNLISALTRNSEYIENVQCTRNQLQEFEDEDLLGKMSILLTPTGYSDGSLNTIIPPYGPSYIENVPYVTSEWNNLQEGWSIDETNNKLVAEATWTGVNKIAQYQITEIGVGQTVRVSFDVIITAGSFVIFKPFSATQISTSGSYSFTGVAVNDFLTLRNKSTNFAGEITNIKVEIIEEADFDFSRGSSATRVNEQGLVEDVQILSGELVQNGNFAEEGSELVTNGNFDNWTADNPDGWTVLNEDANNYVTQDGTYARIVSNDTASIQIKQTIFTIGKTYKVELDAVVNSGNVEGLKLNDATAPATIGYVNSTGHHTFYFKAAGTAFVINRKGGGDTDISIDNVSVKEVGQNWTFGSSWSMGDGVAISDGGASYLTASGSSRFTSGKKYRVSLEIVEYNSGTVSLPFDGAGSNANYQNSAGVKTADIIVVNNNSPIYIYSSAFDGTIDNVSVKEVTDDTDLPRIDYSPYSGAGTCGHLLLEPQITNFVTYSEDFSTWTKQNFPSNSETTTAPNGDTVGGYDFGDGYIFIDTANLNGTSDYTNSIYIKANKSATIGLRNGGAGGADQSQDINLTTNWVRFTATSTSTSTGAGRLLLDNRSSKGYGVSNLKVFIWGAQQEKLPYATSYIPTSGSAVTRSAEVANNSGNADLFNDSEGVLYAEIAALANDGTFRQLTISDGSTSNRVSIDFTSTDNQIRSFSSSGGSTAANMTGTVTDSKQFNKIAVKYKLNDYALWINGSEVYTDINAATPVGLQELAFDNGGGSNYFYGDVKCVAVFKEALSNNELELLTSEGYNSFAALAAAYNYNVI